MIQLFTTSVCASLATISTIVFIDLIVNFKRPLNLKITLLCITFSIITYCTGIIYCYYTRYNRWIIEFPSIFVTAAGLCFFSILYLQRIKKYVFAFAITMILTQLFFFLYFSYINKVNLDVNLGGIKDWFYTRMVIRSVFTIISLWLFVSLYKKILGKYDAENLYFKHLKQWSLILLLCINPIWIANLIKITNSTSAGVEQLLRLVGYFGLIICFLFRPRFLNKISTHITLFDKQLKSIDADYEINVSYFENLFLINLHYLNKDASIETIANKLNVSEDILNNFIANKYGVSYNDLLNKSRVSYFVDLISTGQYKDFTIDTLAQKSGFGTRQHLYKHFKRFHGGTPSDLMKAVNNKPLI